MAVLRLEAMKFLELDMDVALNGVPVDYHHRAWWYEEMGLTGCPVAERAMLKLEKIGKAVALENADLLSRMLAVCKADILEVDRA